MNRFEYCGLLVANTFSTISRLLREGNLDGAEQLVGFYVIEAADLDEAVKYAAKCPAASVGAVEVRPIISTT